MDFEKSRSCTKLLYHENFLPLFLSYIYYRFFKSINPLKFQEDEL